MSCRFCSFLEMDPSATPVAESVIINLKIKRIENIFSLASSNTPILNPSHIHNSIIQTDCFFSIVHQDRSLLICLHHHKCIYLQSLSGADATPDQICSCKRQPSLEAHPMRAICQNFLRHDLACPLSLQAEFMICAQESIGMLRDLGVWSIGRIDCGQLRIIPFLRIALNVNFCFKRLLA